MRSVSTRYIFKSAAKRAAAALFDAAGSFFRPPVRPSIPADPKILLLRMDQTGDVLFAEPALRYLRKKFPKSRIDMLVGPWAAPLARQFQGVNEVKVFADNWFSPQNGVGLFSPSARAMANALRACGYDMGMDLRGDLRNIVLMRMAGIRATVGYGVTGGGFLLNRCLPYDFHAHQVDLNLRLAAEAVSIATGREEEIPTKEQMPPRLSCPDPMRSDVAAMGLPPKGRRLLVHTEAGYPSKRWDAKCYAELLRLLVAAGWHPMLIGVESSRDYRLPGVLDLRGKTDLPQLSALIAESDALIGNDSAPAHMAAALGKPCVVLFSAANDPERWRPIGPRVRVLYHHVACSPCESKQCLRPSHECMDAIIPQQVQDALKELL